MKKIIVLVLLGICLSPIANAQKVVILKPWQTSVNIAGGANYQGVGGQIALDARVNISDFGLVAALSYDSKNIEIDSYMGKNDGKYSGVTAEISGYYSLYRLLFPAPIDIKPYIGFVYAMESVKKPDNSSDKNNGIGNSFGVTFQYYVSSSISLLVKQSGYYIYNTPFGELRGSTLLGVNILL